MSTISRKPRPGCRFFAFCKGHCPGTAIHGDWRNRTVHCRFWYALFERIERDCDPQALLTDQVKDRLVQRLLALTPERPGNGQWNHLDTPHGDSHEDTHEDHSDIPVTVLDHDPDEEDHDHDHTRHVG